MQDKVFLIELKEEQIKKLKQRQEDKILEKENADFLIKLIQNAESKEDVLKLSALGMSLKRTGFHFDVRLEKSDRTIKYFVKNEKLSFEPLSEAESTKESDSKILDEKCGLQQKAQMDKAEAVEMRKQGEAEVSLVNATLEQKITHTLIIGDNYPALLNLLINYKRKVKVIYIDPPYGKDDLGEFAHTNYDNAITRDNLLSMLYPRLQLAKQLLCDDGVIFCSIDDRNQAYVKGLFDEVFGEGNFISNLVWQKKKGGSQDSQHFAKEHEYILCYQKQNWEINEQTQEQTEKDFNKVINGRKAKILKLEKWGNHSLRTDRPTLYYPIKDPNGNDFYPIAPNGNDGCWRKKPENLDENHIFWQEDSKGKLTPYEVIYFDEVLDKQKIIKTRTIFTEFGTTTDATKEIQAIFGDKVFDTPKPVNLLKHLLKISTTNPGDYVDLQADSMDCHEFANAKSRNDKGAYTNTTTTGGGANSPHSLESKKVDSTDIDFKAEITSNNDSKILQGKEQVDKAEAVEMRNCGFQGGSEGSYLSGSNRADTAESAIYRSNATPEIILDFFAGSGTTAHAVMELNREDGGNRKAILVTNNEKTELNPNGIAYDVTTKRLKRIMSGECYDGDKGFKWLEKNTPYGDGLEVLEIESLSDMDTSIFDKIDERLYGLDFADSKQEKIKWVCENFEATCKSLESKQDSSAFSKAHKESILHTDNGDSTKEDK